MPLVTTTEMFKKAYHGGYAIGAFNVNNMEIVQGITEAAQELNAPLILQVSKGARKYANHTYLMKLVEAAVINTGLPIALHLDHGDSFELCKSCIDGGFTSVMIDASSKPFEENIALTKQVVEYAHDHGVVVEAELGTLAGIEDEVNVSAEDSSYTRPEDVQEFVERTGCDSLAIAIGTSHGIVGVLNDELFVMDEEDPEELRYLLHTPSSELGSCRYKMKDPEVDDTDYKRILEIFKKYNVRYFFYNGGNDSMDTCNKISRYMKSVGYDCRVMGVPKTIDNDLFGTDHCPGFASAAKYIATSCMEIPAGWPPAPLWPPHTVPVLI